ncbi:unnamed protein product [Adineta ricciae]|uniref:Mono(ADP-ribosyl)transferase n=1 Tax=Adineta ricciae TaxID=249248 RepID=A0A815YAD1_ADIRI|nr:unnamed protein product [Adineta ricciae]
MDEFANSAEDVILACLRSAHQDTISIDQLQATGIDTYEFDDVDECVQYIVSLDPEDTFVFIWLGFGWNHLIPILHQFEQIHCIYLHEPTHHRSISKVHGVFIHPDELLQQLVRDIRVSQEGQSTHLNVFYNQETTTIHNPQGNPIQAIWSEVLLQCLIRMPTPPTNVYGEMIKEARYFYRNNSVQLAQIDDFEKNYRREDAIEWYSRDSFVYRLVNKALRTQNLVILFKFRFIIRDIYEHLKKLYHEQYLTRQSNNEQASTIKLYRAMKVSSGESYRLRSCKAGGILSINSFVSTSLDPVVAMAYLGDDLERDIMLEIIIDKRLLNSSIHPFACIRSLSKISDEEEVLLSMGTTLRIESVSTSNRQYRNSCIQARLSYDMDRELKELREFILEEQLLCANDLERVKQVQVLCAQRNHRNVGNICQSIFEMRNLLTDLNYSDSVIPDLLRATSDLVTSLSTSMDEIDPSGTTKRMMSPLLQCFTNFPRCLKSNDGWGQLDQQLSTLIVYVKDICESFSIPLSHPMFSNIQVLKSGIEINRGNHEKALQCFLTAQPSSTGALLKNVGTENQWILTSIIKSATALGRNDYSENILEDLHDSAKPQAHVLKISADYHMDKKDWPMAIMYYRQIIEDCNLPVNSILIVEAYCSIGRAFFQLRDLESASLNFNRAHRLLLQHHSPTHTLLGEIESFIQWTEMLRNLK